VRVVVVDVHVFGVGLVRDLHTVFPGVKLLALANRPRDRARALKAGAAAALPRNSSPGRIASAIRRLSAAR
jgi:DNA-binding NarL/FixJ family response regulator